jgi:hypothetical protein
VLVVDLLLWWVTLGSLLTLAWSLSLLLYLGFQKCLFLVLPPERKG